MNTNVDTSALEVLTFDNVCELAHEADAIVIDGNMIDDIKPFYDWLGYNEKESETTRIECSFINQTLTLYRKIQATGTIAERAVAWYSGYSNKVLANALQADSLGAYWSEGETDPLYPEIIALPDKSILTISNWEIDDEIPTLTAGTTPREDGWIDVTPDPHGRLVIKSKPCLHFADACYEGWLVFDMSGTMAVVIEYQVRSLTEEAPYDVDNVLTLALTKHFAEEFEVSSVVVLDSANSL